MALAQAVTVGIRSDIPQTDGLATARFSNASILLVFRDLVSLPGVKAQGISIGSTWTAGNRGSMHTNQNHHRDFSRVTVIVFATHVSMLH